MWKRHYDRSPLDSKDSELKRAPFSELGPITELPSTEELRTHRGFPTVEQEKKLRSLFFQTYKEKIRAYLIRKASVNPYSAHFAWEKHFSGAVEDRTENKLDQITAYLYGIYLFNLIISSELIHENLTDTTHQYAGKKYGYQDEWHLVPNPLQVSDLDDWPLSIEDPGSRTARATADLWSCKICLYLAKFLDEPLKTRKKVIYSQSWLKIVGDSAYEITNEVDWIRVGLEEASHIYLEILRRKKRDRQIGPLRDLKNRSTIQELQFENPQFGLDYNSLLGNEFAAEIIKGQFIQRYEPDLWKNGYERYQQMLFINRRKAKMGIFTRILSRSGESP